MTPLIPTRPSSRLRAAAGLLCAGLITMFIVTSCSARQQIRLRPDGSGSVQFHVAISKTLMDAADSLSQGGAGATKPGQFDIPAIKKVFSKNNALKLESLGSPSPGVLTGSFGFSHIGELFKGKSGGPSDLITFTRRPTGNTLTVHITRTNFADVAELTGMTSNPLYQMFGPEQNAGTSADDLDQMMVYVLGDSGPAALKSSAIDVVITVDGKITNQTGGVVDGNSVRFHIPLVKLLLLEQPLDYSVTFS